jgi:hypothetical protein
MQRAIRKERYEPRHFSDLGNLELGQLQQFLPDVNFPASKEDVVSNLESSGASQEMVDQVKSAGTDTFNSADEVLQKVQGRQ